MYRNSLQEIQVTGAGLADDSSTMVLHFGVRRIAVAQPAAEEGRTLGYIKSWIRASLSFAGSFYCIAEEGIMVLDVTGKCLRLVMAAEEEQGLEKCPYQDTVNLVDNDGELILVKSKGATDLPTKYEVHRVDLQACKTVPTHGLRGRAVFVSAAQGDNGRALSVHVGLSSSISADIVYRCSTWANGWPKIDAYHLLDGSIQHDFSGGKIVECLWRYITGSSEAYGGACC
jgi:hypothetical protein